MEHSDSVNLVCLEGNKLSEWTPPEPNNPENILMVGLFIRATDIQRRNELRATIFKHPVFTGNPSKAIIRFIIGHAQENDMDAVKNEMMEKQDMVLLPFMDTYYNLGIKSQLFFNYYSSLQHNYKFIMKLDDDAYFDFSYMIRYLEDHPVNDGRPYWYIGAMYYGAFPERDPENKYHVPIEEYPDEIFPVYANGGAYILSQPLARKITLMKYPIIHIEDANIGYRIHKGKESGAFDDEVQYVDITDVYANGKPVMFSQIETIEKVKEAYANDINTGVANVRNFLYEGEGESGGEDRQK